MEAEAIAEVLGGPKVLGKAIKSPDDLAQLVRKGLPVGAISALAESLQLGTGVLARKLGIPQRTLTRRLSRGDLLTFRRIGSYRPHGTGMCRSRGNDRRPGESH